MADGVGSEGAVFECCVISANAGIHGMDALLLLL